MFRHRVVADENTDIDAMLSDVRARLNQSELSETARAFAMAEVAPVLARFVTDGRKLSQHGSQFRASHDVTGDGYAIKVTYAPAVARGWLDRLLGR